MACKQGQIHPHKDAALSRNSPPGKPARASSLAAIQPLQGLKMQAHPPAPRRAGGRCLSRRRPPSVTATHGAPGQGRSKGLLQTPLQLSAVDRWGQGLHPLRHPRSKLGGSRMVCSRCCAHTSSTCLHTGCTSLSVCMSVCFGYLSVCLSA